MTDFAGFSVTVSNALPIRPTPAANARRIVRHRLTDVLAWLGENVGPKPGESTHMVMINNSVVVSAKLMEHLR